MSEKEMTIPKNGETPNEEPTPITKEESDVMEKVFFEDDEKIKLRDGRTYTLPPLSLKEARKLIKKLNSIETGIILMNLMENEEGESQYDDLMEVLAMGFKPYYSHVTAEYLEEYVDVVTAKKIIDIIIGMNGLKKLL